MDLHTNLAKNDGLLYFKKEIRHHLANLKLRIQDWIYIAI